MVTPEAVSLRRTGRRTTKKFVRGSNEQNPVVSL